MKTVPITTICIKTLIIWNSVRVEWYLFCMKSSKTLRSDVRLEDKNDSNKKSACKLDILVLPAHFLFAIHLTIMSYSRQIGYLITVSADVAM